MWPGLDLDSPVAGPYLLGRIMAGAQQGGDLDLVDMAALTYEIATAMGW
jgi:hypothetical protein